MGKSRVAEPGLRIALGVGAKECLLQSDGRGVWMISLHLPQSQLFFVNRRKYLFDQQYDTQ
jgi:hypothetical protein